MVISGTRIMGHGTTMNGTRGVGRGASDAIAETQGDEKARAALRKACRDFEAFFVSCLLRQMWQAAEAIGGEKPFISQTYRDLFTFEVAQGLTPSLRLGIAEMLYRALSDAEQMGGKAENPSPSQKHRR
jgi:Rod binding domain-containing protein